MEIDDRIFLGYRTPGGNQRWFEDGDVLRLKDCGGGRNNREFVFVNERGYEIRMWYSQLCRVYWDEEGNTYTPRLILLGGKRVEIVGLPLEEFKQLCEGKRLKSVWRKTSSGLYTTSTKRYRDIFIDERMRWRCYVDCVDIVREELVKPFLSHDVDKLAKEGGSWLGSLFDIEVLD